MSAVITLQEPASHTPASIATQVLLIWLYGTMVVQRVAPTCILACLWAIGTIAGTLLEAAMLTARWPAPKHTKLAVAIVASIFDLVLFVSVRQQQRARTSPAELQHDTGNRAGEQGPQHADLEGEQRQRNRDGNH